MPKPDLTALTRFARQRRTLLAGGGMLVIALAVWLLWPEPTVPAARAPASGAPATMPATTTAAEDGSFWDRLLHRQQAESAAARKSAGAIPETWPLPAGAPSTAPAAVAGTVAGYTPATGDAAEAARRRAAREAIRQHLAELLTLADEQSRSGRLGDTSRMLKTVEKLAADMRTAGMPSVIDVNRMRQTLAAAEKAQRIGDALAQEAAKGKAADPQRLEQLNQQMRELQPTLSQSPVDTRALLEVLRAR